MNNTTNKNKKQKENLLSKTFNSKIEDSWHLSEKRKKLNKKLGREVEIKPDC